MPYIHPITKIHSSFDEAQKFFEDDGGIVWIDEEGATDPALFLEAPRNLIVGEPGIGKTLLLEQMLKSLRSTGVDAEWIELRGTDVVKRLCALFDADNVPRALCLDGLDEIPAAERRRVIQVLDEVSSEHPETTLHISGRWVFVRRYAQYFQNYRYISIAPFTMSQIRSFLSASGHSESDIERLLEQMSFGHLTSILQIPRYLAYLEAYLAERGVEAAASVSRTDLFEFFVYRKLELEEEKLDTNKRALIKRLLEKLALAMEICQTNVLSQDDLMTFFDELDSDLKLVALSQIPVETLYDYSLIRVSSGSLNQVEFENAEFQEYLAAKELSRFADPSRGAFALATDPDAHQIYPSWHNTLTFLTDLVPDLLEPIVEFSGLRRRDYALVDEGFFRFLSRLTPERVQADLRPRLFREIIEYHRRTLQWLPFHVSESMSKFYEPSLEGFLRDEVARAEAANVEAGAERRDVPLANIAYVIANLLRSGPSVDRDYWRDKLIGYAKEAGDSGVLQRRALDALGELGDPTVLEQLSDLRLDDELVENALLETCVKLDPDHSTTRQLVFKLVRQGKARGRDGLVGFRKPDSLKEFLLCFLGDESFRRGFLRGMSISAERDVALADRIKQVGDEEVRELAAEVLVASFQRDVVYEYHAGDSHFFSALWDALRNDRPEFVGTMVERIKGDSNTPAHLFYAHSLLGAVLQPDDVAPFIEVMRKVDTERAAVEILALVRDSGRPCAEEVYEAGRVHLPKMYSDLERAKQDRAREREEQAGERRAEQLAGLRDRLEPEPGKFTTDVFEFFTRHHEELDLVLSDEDRARLLHLTQTVLGHWDPGEQKLTISDEGGRSFTMSISIRVFGEAIEAARCLGCDLTPYRRQLLNLIPFTYHGELQMVFDAIPNIEASELEPVLAVYRNRDSDLWRYRPHSLIAAVKRYNNAHAAPVLRALVTEREIDSDAREQALVVLDSLCPDPEFLREVFDRYSECDGDDQKLAETANAALISRHRDSGAIKWRLEEVMGRAAPFQEPRGVHGVSPLENEIRLGKKFARPLMLLAEPSYVEEYLALVDSGIALWGRGREFYAYADYLWGIALAYFENLKELGSYAPLEQLESRIASARDDAGTNWLASKFVELRRKYLRHLGPENIADAVQKYNEVRQYSPKRISNAEELFHHVREVLRTDVRRYIEGEGGHRFLSRAKGDREDFGQKALKAHIENSLGRRGFWVDVTREPQLLDDRRVDFLVRYGFVGPVLIELKLTSNRDLKGRSLDESQSYVNMRQYMEGFNAPHGIFLVIDNEGASNLEEVDATYGAIPNVHVEIFRCAPLEAE
jgi:hypothetical protein